VDAYPFNSDILQETVEDRLETGQILTDQSVTVHANSCGGDSGDICNIDDRVAIAAVDFKFSGM